MRNKRLRAALLMCLIFATAKIQAQSTGDFDGSGRSGIAVYRPSTGTYFVWPATGHIYNVTMLPDPTSIPLTADFDGDGRTDLAVWEPYEGVLLFLPSTSMTLQKFPAGQISDVPLVGDFDGSGRSGIAMWRPSTLTFYVWPAVKPYFTLQLGQTGDIPLLGDFDGDHVADFAVWRPSTKAFYFVYSSTKNPGSFAIPGGQLTDIPLIADFDGSGKTGVGVWRPSTATFYLYPATAPTSSVQLGQTGDIPLTADFDGDGKSDLAVWRPSNAVLYFINSSSGSHQSFQAGMQGDVPMPSEPATISLGATTDVTITGKALSGTTPLAGQNISLNVLGILETQRTASDGSYSFTVGTGATVYLTPPCCGGWTPSAVSFSNVDANQTVNFQTPPGLQ